MGETSSLNALRISSTPTLSQSSYFSSPLLSKINWAFWFCVTATASYCLYNLYQALQLKNHNGFGLDDRLKLAKCQALYAEAKEKEFADAQPLLQECQNLLASIIDTTYSHDKERLLVQIAQYYAKNDPARSYSIALQQPNFYCLFKIAQILQKENPNYDNDLFVRAWDAKKREDLRPNRIHFTSADFDITLKFAKAFHSKNNTLADECMTKAVEIANSHEKALVRFRMYCQIAQCYQEMGNPEQAKSSIESAQKLLDDQVTDAEKIDTYLTLAHTYFSIGDFNAMDQQLDEVQTLMNKDPLTTAKSLNSLANLIDKIKKAEGVESKFKNFAVEDLINKAFEALEQTNENRAAACLTIASFYQEELLNDIVKKERALNIAFDEILHLPEETDEAIKFKVHLLELLSLCYEKEGDVTRAIGQSLESIYDLCPAEFDRTSRLHMEKPGFGMNILRIYKKAGLLFKSNLFFQKYLLDLQKPKDVFDKISRLVTYAGDHLTPEQIKTQLETAEALLSQMNSSIHYKHALALIIEGYSKIDPQKSVQLMNNYENRKANGCIVTAVAIPALIGISYYYPTAGLVISGVSSVARLWTQI